MQFYLGVDVGSTKTHALIADKSGQAVGFGAAGPGNHERVGYAGLSATLKRACDEALASAGLDAAQIAGAGFGVSGFDWPSEKADTLNAIGTLGLRAPLEAVNDTLLGLLAGSSEGWGLAVVSGSGCNCRGRTRDGREGKVTGHGEAMGEGAGASELIQWAVRAVAHAWTRRGPSTRLTSLFVQAVGASGAADLLEGLINERYNLETSAALLVFEAAEAGDAVAGALVRRAGTELGELANAVIRQLEFERLDFEVVLIGSLFNAGAALIEPMRQTVTALAPGARLVRLAAPPVVGAVLLGMEQAGLNPSAAVRERLIQTSLS